MPRTVLGPKDTKVTKTSPEPQAAQLEWVTDLLKVIEHTVGAQSMHYWLKDFMGN